MNTLSIEVLHNDLKAGKINHLQFINSTKYAAEFQNWCKSVGQAPTEENAELWYDMHGFDEMEVKTIICETV